MYYAVTHAQVETHLQRFIRECYLRMFGDRKRAAATGQLYDSFYGPGGPRVPCRSEEAMATLLEASEPLRERLAEVGRTFVSQALLGPDESFLDPAVSCSYLTEGFEGYPPGSVVVTVRTNRCRHLFVLDNLVLTPEDSRLIPVPEYFGYMTEPAAVPPFVVLLGEALAGAIGGERLGRATPTLFPAARKWVPLDYERVNEIAHKPIDEFERDLVEGHIENASAAMARYAKLARRATVEPALAELERARIELQQAVSLAEHSELAVYDYAVAMTQYLLVLLEFANTTTDAAAARGYRRTARRIAGLARRRAEERMETVIRDRAKKIGAVRRRKGAGLFETGYFQWEDAQAGLRPEYHFTRILGRSGEQARRLAETDLVQHRRAVKREVADTLEPVTRLVERWTEVAGMPERAPLRPLVAQADQLA